MNIIATYAFVYLQDFYVLPHTTWWLLYTTDVYWMSSRILIKGDGSWNISAPCRTLSTYKKLKRYVMNSWDQLSEPSNRSSDSTPRRTFIVSRFHLYLEFQWQCSKIILYTIRLSTSGPMCIIYSLNFWHFLEEWSVSWQYSLLCPAL